MHGPDTSSWAITLILLGVAGAALAALLLGSLGLKIALRVVEGKSPGFLRLLGVSAVSVLVALAIAFLLGVLQTLLLGIPDYSQGVPPPSPARAGAGLVSLMLGPMLALVANSALLRTMLRRSDGSRFGWGRALAVSVLQGMFAVAAGLLLFGFVAIVAAVASQL